MAGGVPDDIAAIGLGLAIFAALAAYMATDRKEAAMWLRFGLYSGALAVCAASLWIGIVLPLQAAHSLGDAVAWLTGLDGLGLVLLVVPPPAAVLLTVLWFEVVLGSLKYLHGGGRRRRAESDLHGHAQLLGRRFLRRLARRQGILLGQWGAGRNAKLIGWSLEGSAITVAPPRAGKGATIAINLLSPDYRGFDGSTVTIDPRGELWCIASRRRRELGRRAVLIDPFGVVRGHKKQFPDTHLPDTDSASYNPLDFIRDDDGLAVRDINVLLDALLTPPRPGAHQNSMHFYESARAIVAGYMAWVRFKEPPGRRTLAILHEMLSATPEAREDFAAALREGETFRRWARPPRGRTPGAGRQGRGRLHLHHHRQPARLPQLPRAGRPHANLQLRSPDPGRRRYRPLRGRARGDHRARQGLAASVGRHPQRRRRHQSPRA